MQTTNGMDFARAMLDQQIADAEFKRLTNRLRRICDRKAQKLVIGRGRQPLVSIRWRATDTLIKGPAIADLATLREWIGS